MNRVAERRSVVVRGGSGGMEHDRRRYLVRCAPLDPPGNASIISDRRGRTDGGADKLDLGGMRSETAGLHVPCVCDQLKATPYQIVISGHTDNVQIRVMADDPEYL